MGKKSKRIPDFDNSYFLQLNADDKRFGRIYAGMAKNEKFIKLKPTTKWLLLICIIHSTSSENYSNLKAHRQKEGSEEREYGGVGYFMFWDAQLKKYGFDTDHAYSHFKELTDAGFIDLLERNQHRRLPNVYRLSVRWKEKKEKES